MIIKDFNTDDRVLVIAEIGNNHEGDFALAQEMVAKAADAGVDAVKFQTFKTELFSSRKDEARFARLKKFELTYDQFAQLGEQARKRGLLFISTPLDLESAAFLGKEADALKIASGDNTFYPLLQAVGETGKPVILSCGISNLEEIATATDVIEKSWQARSVQGQLALLHCVAAYPVEPAQANLRAITTMRNTFNHTVGYSDHTLGIDAAVLSVAAGARIVEKHFTIDKNHSDFRDHQLSADPQEMAQLVQRIRAAEVLLGSGEKQPQEAEAAIRPAVRRSIVAVRDLPAGHVLQSTDLTWVRPSGGLAPGNEHLLLGRTLVSALQAGDFVTPDNVAP